MNQKQTLPLDELLSHTYDRISELAQKILHEKDSKNAKAVAESVHEAKELLLKAGEIPQQHAEDIATSILRDLHDAATSLLMEERDLTDWLRLDLLLIEKKALHRFQTLVDFTKVGLSHLKKTLQRLDEWRTGEITTIGTLQCKKCGEILHFHKTGRIPPCPKCQGTTFQRIKD